jgi:hypothetical protein
MRKLRMAAYAAVLLAGAGPAAAQTPRAIVQQAVKAHGGEERLSRIRAEKVRLRGTLFVDKVEAPFVVERTVQLPSQFKSVMEVSTGEGPKHTLVHVVNGDKVMVAVDNKPAKDPAVLAEVRETVQLDRAARLVPLLRDRAYELAPLDEIKVNDRPAVGVRVTARGRKELRLYFDKSLGFLVKAEQVLDDGGGKQIRQEHYFGDFKDFGGYKRPVKFIAFRDGKKVMEAEVVDVRYYDKLDDSEFSRP